jgi:hypothetical protein
MSADSNRESIGEFDVVALLEAMPSEGLAAGQVGTVVLTHGTGEAFEVEFFEDPHRPTVVTLTRAQILKLRGLRAGAA